MVAINIPQEKVLKKQPSPRPTSEEPNTSKKWSGTVFKGISMTLLYLLFSFLGLCWYILSPFFNGVSHVPHWDLDFLKEIMSIIFSWKIDSCCWVGISFIEAIYRLQLKDTWPIDDDCGWCEHLPYDKIVMWDMHSYFVLKNFVPNTIFIVGFMVLYKFFSKKINKKFQDDNHQTLKQNLLKIGTWIGLGALYVPTVFVAFYLNAYHCVGDFIGYFANSGENYPEYCEFWKNFELRTYHVYPNILIVFVTLILATLIFSKR